MKKVGLKEVVKVFSVDFLILLTLTIFQISTNIPQKEHDIK